MKSTALMAVALAVIPKLVLGIKNFQARTAYNTAMETAPSMTFTGPLHVGGPNVTLTGTAESIYHKIVELNPLISSAPYHRNGMASWRSAEGQLATQTESRWTTGSPNVLRESATWAASTDIVVRREAGVAALGSAARMAAAYFSATIAVLFQNPYPIDVWCGNLVGDFYDIAAECGEEWYDGLVISLKGQIFRDGPPAWNTIVKRQSC
ncbi:hypothetical protein NQ176_g6255 [Zarea fungicola]|uniref:Uncharacterized protein n=1 Tax=Zarea fungicola TaxID=93591 RepID=A0ACC1N6F3_9HYPO|nr:hypothetical protein NQ176_g6255 [Lecanicillium fungicola]